MATSSRMTGLKRFAWLLAVLWTASVAVTLLWSLNQERRQVLAIARQQALVAVERDLVLREWAAERGGVYVSVSEETPPNPYLAYHDDREITTPSGRLLTLVNPAYLLRQVHEQGARQSAARGRLTSLLPLRPENAPDPWEASALRTLEGGVDEVSSVQEIDGLAYMRVMRPMVVTESCLQCHAQQGYEVGDVRGGMDYAIPLGPLWAIARPKMLSATIGFGVLWFLGLGGLGLGTRRLGQSLQRRDQAERELEESNLTLERRVTQRTAELHAANEELEAFAHSVSHDLRAPLRAIDGFAELVLDEHADQLDQEGARLLNVVRENSGLMGTLIEDLLELSRLGRQALEPRKLNMKELVEEVIQDLESQTPGPRREVTLGPLPSAWGDHTLIRQVWINLLANAFKFNGSGDPGVIEIQSSVKGEEVVYSVKDNGAGFDMAYAEKLFNVFERLHSGEEYEGTGVGLSIVKRIVERHGGRVWAEGKVDEGATFWFTLPMSEGLL